tara:strand:- start:285 stop:608 length:324 start_codon:yes stop_codon:yes gene_type:complete
MRMLEYKLHAPMNGHGMSTPVWVDNGGHWYNNADHTMIGFAPDTTEYYIPDSVDFKTEAEVKTRVVAMHQVSPMRKMDPAGPGGEEGDVMTDAEVETMVGDWVAANT